MGIMTPVVSVIVLSAIYSPILGQEQSEPVSQASPGLNHSSSDQSLQNSKIKNEDRLTLGNILLPRTPTEWTLDFGGVLMFTAFALSEHQVRLLPWERDKWTSTNGGYLSKYDKVEHFAAAAAGHTVLIGLDQAGIARSTPLRRIKLSLTIITWWEVKDSVVPWERYGSLGGEGFSMKDWIASASGVLGTELLNFALKKVF